MLVGPGPRWLFFCIPEKRKPEQKGYPQRAAHPYGVSGGLERRTNEKECLSPLPVPRVCRSRHMRSPPRARHRSHHSDPHARGLCCWAALGRGWSSGEHATRSVLASTAEARRPQIRWSSWTKGVCGKAVYRVCVCVKRLSSDVKA